MAGDWIPIRTDLSRCREVLAISRSTGRPRHEVAGLLVDFWGWASAETADGILPGLTADDLAAPVGGDVAFWEAVAAVGWLSIDGNGLGVPGFERWLSNGGKARLTKNRRQANWRGRRGDVDATVDGIASTRASTREQDRRGQNRKDIDHLDSCSCSWEKVKTETLRLAGEWAETVPPSKQDRKQCRADREFLLRLGVLRATGQISENAVTGALEAVRHRSGDCLEKPLAYFRTVLQEQTGGGLGKLLAGVDFIPPEVIEPKRKAAKP